MCCIFNDVINSFGKIEQIPWKTQYIPSVCLCLPQYTPHTPQANITAPMSSYVRLEQHTDLTVKMFFERYKIMRFSPTQIT